MTKETFVQRFDYIMVCNICHFNPGRGSKREIKAKIDLHMRLRHGIKKVKVPKCVVDPKDINPLLDKKEVQRRALTLIDKMEKMEKSK